jgi:methyltransferase family protein
LLDRRPGADHTGVHDNWREALVTGEGPAATPTLTDQVSRLYDLVAGYHATHLLEIARELGVWEALAQRPGLTSEELATGLGTNLFYTDVLCRTAFSFCLLEREGAGWRMAPHFDQILGDPASSFYLASAPSVHMVLGEDYREYVRHFRAGTTRSYQEHGEVFMREVAEALRTLPRIFLDLVLPRLPGLSARLQDGGRVLDVGCGGGGRWSRSLSGSPGPPVSGSTWSPTRSTWPGD